MNNIVYKYSRWDCFIKEALSNRYFWFSKPPNFNDPFDSNMNVLLDFEETNVLFNYGNSTLPYPLNNPFEYIKEKADDFGVLCLTKPTDTNEVGDKGYNHLHFWSHYADSHKGIVLGFEASKIESYYSDKIQCNAYLKPVIYRKKPLDIDKDDIILGTNTGNIRRSKITEIFSNNSDGKDFDAFFEQLLLTKDERIWGIENESRIILGGIAINNIKNFNPFSEVSYEVIDKYGKGFRIPYPEGEVLKEVTFGVKFNQSDIKEAISQINMHHKNVKYYQAHLDFKNADITREEILQNNTNYI